MKDWQVTHIINNEKLTIEEFKSKYPIEIQDMIIKMLRIFADYNNVNIKYES